MMGIFEIRGYAERNVHFDLDVIRLTFRESGETSFILAKSVMNNMNVF